MRLRPLASFCRRMGVGLRAGVDILRILDTETRTGSPEHRQVMALVQHDVQQGNSLGKAMLTQKRYFPPLLIQLVHAGELGGRLEQVFLEMADHYDQMLRTRAHFVGRITMPLIQLGLAILIIGAVILIQGLLHSGSELAYDASSVGLRGVGGFITYILVVGSVAGVLAVTALGIVRNWFNCHRVLMPLVQRVPVLGTALTTLGLTRLCMSLSMLLNAGVEARRSLKQAFLSTGNFYFIGGMDRALESVARGESFGDALDAAAVFPQDFIDVVRIGEISGTETESLDHLAHEYRERSKHALNQIAMIASTVIWLGTMGLIAFMALRMALQYVQLLNSFL
jgi:type IV pilus assembly protein PilC